MTGYWFLAGLSLVVSLLLWRTSERPSLIGEHRAIRNHLIEFMRVWIALSLYYLLQPFAAFVATPGGQPAVNCLTRYVPTIFIWHFCVALILGFANIWLRRASLELEISELPRNRDRLVLPLETLTSTWQVFVKWSTEKGILYGFLAALLPLAFAPSLAYSWWVLSVAYSLQILVTSLLFIRLGLAYRSVLQSSLLFGLSISYSLVQLPYGFLAPVGTLRFHEYELALGVLKAVHGLSLAAIAWSYARRQPVREERITAEAFARLAKRLQSRATLRGIQQLMVGGGLATLTLLVLAGPYSCVITLLRGRGLSEVALLPVRLAFLTVLLLAWQVCAYFVIEKLRFRISWPNRRELRQHFAISVQGSDATLAGVEVLSIHPLNAKDRTEHPPQQVILLHGLFSNGAAAWGFLPLVLLHEPNVSCIRSLTYGHGLLTSRTEFDRITRDVASKVGSLIADFSGQTILIGHSLGGIIALKVLPELLAQHPSGVNQGLHHVGIVGAPLLGSGFAKLLFPWGWSRMLGRHSRLLQETLREVLEVIPPVGSARDGEVLIPGLTFIYGSGDSIAGELVQFAAFHGQKIRAPAFHGLGLVFFETQELARVYRRMLSAPPRAVALARAVGRSLLATKQLNASGLFMFTEELDFTNAKLLGNLREEQAFERATLPGLIVEKTFKGQLGKLYERRRDNTPQWSVYWTDLEREVERSVAPTFFVKRWSDDQVFVLYFNRFAGFFAIVPGVERRVTDAAATVQKTHLLGPLSSAVMEKFRDLDAGAVRAVLFEGCDHLGRLREERIAITQGRFASVVDSEGTYYGLYALDGRVIEPAGIDYLYFHVGAPGQPLNLGELALRCYDEVRNSALPIELVDMGQNCWLCGLRLGSRRPQGEEMRLRLSFRRQNCIDLLRGFELFRLEPVLSKGARVTITVSLPGRLLALDPFKVSGGVLKEVSEGRSEEPLEGRYHLESEVEDGDEALGVRFSVDPISTQRRRLRDMVLVEQAGEGDLPSMAGMESLLSVRVAAKLGDLRNRFAVFRDGILVARVGGEVIGYLEFVRWSRDRVASFREISPIEAQHEADGRSAFIWFLGVLPAFRRRGIARRLISEVVSWAETRGIQQVQIVTQVELQAYFEDLGFKEVGEIEEYMPGMLGVFMARGVIL